MEHNIEEHECESEKPLHSKRLGRELAMQYLFRCELVNELPDMAVWVDFYEELKNTHDLRDNRYARKAKEFAEALLQTTAVNIEQIDAAISARSNNWDFDRLSAVDKNIMRVAVCEMLFFNDVPPVVSIDEAVAVARDYSGEDSGSFINGILNGVKDTLSRPARKAAGKAEK